MKRRKIAAVCLSALLLAGCGDVMPEMSDAEAEAIGEYAAITLLKYDAAARSRLVDLSQVQEEAEKPEEPVAVQPEPAPEQPPEQAVQETPIVDRSEAEELTAESLGSCLKLPEGVDLIYDGCDLAANYSGKQYLAVEASDGKQLLILRFTLRNASGTEQKIDLLDPQNLCRVTVNGDYTRNVLTTMLENDLLTYSGDLSDGETQELVLLAEVEAEKAGAVDALTLNLKDGSETYTIRLL